MRIKVAVLGGTGDGVNVAELISCSLSRSGEKLEFIGFLNDRVKNGDFIDELPVIGDLSDVMKFKKEGVKFINTILRIDGSEERSKLIDSLNLTPDDLPTIIHPSSYISPSAEVEWGCVIYPGVTILSQAKISYNSLLLSKCNIGHHTVIGPHNHIGVGAMIGSTVTTGKGVHVGTNATIIENNEIDDFSTLGAGGVLTKSIPTREIWTGNPARFLRNVM